MDFYKGPGTIQVYPGIVKKGIKMLRCAADLNTCRRMAPAGQKALCKAKRIGGYTNLENDDLARKCCDEGGMAMPKNLQFMTVTADKNDADGKNVETIVKESLKKLLKNAVDGKIDRYFGSKRNSCFAGTFPGLDARQVTKLIQDKSALTLMDEGKLDGKCVNKCLDIDSNFTCAIKPGKSSSYKNDTSDVLFFANYMEGIEATKKTFASCKNDVDLFWNAIKKMGNVGSDMYYNSRACDEGNLSCNRMLAGDNSFGNRSLSMFIGYGCKENEVNVDFTYLSEKYDDRAFGATEYDQEKHNIDMSKIAKSEGIDVPVDKVKSVFGDAIKSINKRGPDFNWEDKSFSVSTSFSFMYPALKTQEDVDELVKRVRSVRSVLGSYV